MKVSPESGLGKKFNSSSLFTLIIFPLPLDIVDKKFKNLKIKKATQTLEIQNEMQQQVQKVVLESRLYRERNSGGGLDLSREKL